MKTIEIETVKHTPGPWSNNKWNCEEHQISAKGGTIALVSHGHALVSEGEADANAALIASAPELLESLEDLENRISCMAYDRDTQVLIRRARDVIAKAKGAQ